MVRTLLNNGLLKTMFCEQEVTKKVSLCVRLVDYIHSKHIFLSFLQEQGDTEAHLSYRLNTSTNVW